MKEQEIQPERFFRAKINHAQVTLRNRNGITPRLFAGEVAGQARKVFSEFAKLLPWRDTRRGEA